MKLEFALKNHKLRAILNFIGISLIFGLAYTQDPIYNSVENQNTKFLHGLANAGYGFLTEDWVANTIDPLPAFTWLVQITYQYIHPEYMFYVYYFILFGIYVYSIFALVDYIFKFKKSRFYCLVYFASFLVIHTVHLRIFEYDLGLDLHYGVALQYVLGPVFQPSVFGVLIIASICCSLYYRYYLAVILLAIAATFHPTYLVSAGILTLTYQIVILVRDKNIVKAVLVGLSALLLVLPVYLYMSLIFDATTPEIWQQAQAIIVQLRVPHHSLPELWLKQDDYKSYLKALIVIAALWIIRKTELFLILLIPFLTVVVSTIIQLIIESNTIAFIAPWRLSIFLVPIASSIVLAKLVFGLLARYSLLVSKYQHLITRLSTAIIVVLFIFGTVDQVLSFGYGNTSNKLMEFVKAEASAGDIYLVPPGLSTMKKFRLYTGVPIFINVKTHPYKDTEVIEWHNRVSQASEFYDLPLRRCQTLDNLLEKYTLTHVVLYKEQETFQCDRLESIYQNKNYQVLKIK